MRKELQKYQPYLIDYYHTGSTVIIPKEFQNDDEYKPKDDDWILLSYLGGWEALETLFEKDGFELGGSLERDTNGLQENLEKTRENFGTLDLDHPNWNSNTGFIGGFHSWRKDDLNVILTISQEYFDRFGKATDLARALMLTEKADRVRLFEAIVRDNYPEFDDEDTVWEFKNKTQRVFMDINLIRDRNILLQDGDRFVPAADNAVWDLAGQQLQAFGNVNQVIQANEPFVLLPQEDGERQIIDMPNWAMNIGVGV